MVRVPQHLLCSSVSPVRCSQVLLPQKRVIAYRTTNRPNIHTYIEGFSLVKPRQQQNPHYPPSSLVPDNRLLVDPSLIPRQTLFNNKPRHLRSLDIRHPDILACTRLGLAGRFVTTSEECRTDDDDFVNDILGERVDIPSGDDFGRRRGRRGRYGAGSAEEGVFESSFILVWPVS